jgi:hypothetical protein
MISFNLLTLEPQRATAGRLSTFGVIAGRFVAPERRLRVGRSGGRNVLIDSRLEDQPCCHTSLHHGWQWFHSAEPARDTAGPRVRGAGQQLRLHHNPGCHRDRYCFQKH